MTVTNPRARLALRIGAVLVALAIAVMLVRTLQRDGPAALAAWRTAQLNYAWLTISCVTAVVGQVVFVFGWQRLLNDLAVRASFLTLLRMYLASNLGRYLPAAKVWQMGIIGAMASEAALPGPLVAGASLLQGVLGVAVGGIIVVVTGGAMLGVAPYWNAAPIVAVLGLMALPQLLKLVPAIRAKAIERVPGLGSVGVATMWTLIWTSAATWILWGLALYMLARGLMTDPIAPVTTYVAAWAGPFLGGVIVNVLPAGLGVRDGMMQLIFDRAGVPAGAAIMVVAIARVWATLLEVVPAVVVLALRRKTKQPYP